MIDLPTQKDFETPHHRKAIGALIASIVIFGIVLVVYYLTPKSTPLVEVPVATGGWTEADRSAKQAILDSISVNPVDNLSAAEIKQKQDILKMISRDK